ncbi:MAG: hypothetical protein QMO91_03015 [Candidatus Tisiphia sp.]|nr:hypothetical protein [Candidatus Tisiphia sp.]
MSKITSNGNITLIADKELHINTHIATKGSFDAETKEGDMHVGSKDCINTLKSKGLLNLIINNNISIYR